jgi:hypothetical protein
MNREIEEAEKYMKIEKMHFQIEIDSRKIVWLACLIFPIYSSPLYALTLIA